MNRASVRLEVCWYRPTDPKTHGKYWCCCQKTIFCWNHSQSSYVTAIGTHLQVCPFRLIEGAGITDLHCRTTRLFLKRFKVSHTCPNLELASLIIQRMSSDNSMHASIRKEIPRKYLSTLALMHALEIQKRSFNRDENRSP